jgi:hypothetical protein
MVLCCVVLGRPAVGSPAPVTAAAEDIKEKQAPRKSVFRQTELTKGQRACLAASLTADQIKAWEQGKRPAAPIDEKLIARCLPAWRPFWVGPGVGGRGLRPSPRTLEDPGHGPRAADAGCGPAVFMWIEPERLGDVYFDDEEFTVHYSVDCATSLSVSDGTRTTAAEALYLYDAARRGEYADAGESAALTTTMSGSRSFPPEGYPATPEGTYDWTVSARNGLNAGAERAEETILWRAVERPALAASCDERRECIEDMVAYIVPLVHAGVTANDALEDTVDAFRDHIYDRQEIGYRLEIEVETLGTAAEFQCTECAGADAIHYSEATPEVVYLDFCDRTYPTDYAVLHELTHKIGFDSRLIDAYVAAGLWERADPGSTEADEQHALVERMTAEASGAAFDRSRDYSR